jgi:hypothetical protein
MRRLLVYLFEFLPALLVFACWWLYPKLSPEGLPAEDNPDAMDPTVRAVTVACVSLAGLFLVTLAAGVFMGEWWSWSRAWQKWGREWLKIWRW